MPLQRNYPSLDASGTPARTLALADLRELVRETEALPANAIVRGRMIPFHMPDLGNQLGGRLMRLALDVPDTDPDAGKPLRMVKDNPQA